MRALFFSVVFLTMSLMTLELPAQIQAIAAADSLTLGSYLRTTETMQAEAQFLESVMSQTQQLTQLRDSLIKWLEIPETDAPAGSAAPSREEMQNMLDMYNRMLRTNEMILEGKARIVGHDNKEKETNP